MDSLHQIWMMPIKTQIGQTDVLNGSVIIRIVLTNYNS